MRELLKSINQRPVAYFPVYKKITGNVHGAILLSQLMYWFSKADKFWKTNDEIAEEIGFTERELKTAKSSLKNVDFVIVTREGLPAKTYYSIDWDAYEKALNPKNSSQDETVQTGQDETVRRVRTKPSQEDRTKPSQHYYNAEITSETTAETTTDSARDDLPEWLDYASWSEWTAYRKEIRKPITKAAAKKHLAVLEQHKDSQAEIIERSINSGWTGLFAPKGRTSFRSGKEWSQDDLMRFGANKGRFRDADGLFNAEVIDGK